MIHLDHIHIKSSITIALFLIVRLGVLAIHGVIPALELWIFDLDA